MEKSKISEWNIKQNRLYGVKHIQKYSHDASYGT